MFTTRRTPIGRVFCKKRPGHVSTGRRVGFRAYAEGLENRLLLSAYIVTDNSDNAADVGSLRHAILQANTAGSGTISFNLTAGQNTITLENAATYPNGFLYPAGPSAFIVTGDITIQGSGQLIQRDASAADFRLFYVAPGANLTLNDVQLSGGIAQGRNGGLGDSFGGGGGAAAGLGGGIFVEHGTLTLTGVTLNGNQAIGGNGGDATGGSGQGGAGGGGLSGAGGIGHLHSGGPGGGPNGGAGGGGAQDGAAGGFGGGGGGAGSSAFGGRGGLGGGGGGGGNTSGFGGDGGFGGGGGGGGSFFGSGGVGGFGGGHGGQGRSGSGGGGGAGFGGGIFLDQGTLSITNSTLTANTAQGGRGGTGGIGGGTGTGGYGYGGAIFNVNSTVTLAFDTLAFNTAGAGGALYDLSFLDSSGHFSVSPATATLTDSILSNSTSSDLVVDERGFGGTASVTSTMDGSSPTNIVPSTNIVGGSVTGSFITADPQLSSDLSTKAGFTPLLMFTSNPGPATSPGGIAISGDPTDQWGQTRITPDIGAFEVVPATSPPGNAATPADVTINAGGNASFSSTATGAPAPTGQWQLSTDGGSTFNNISNGGVYSGATSGTLSVTGGLAPMNGYEYQDVFTNGTGTATSDPATLTVDFAPSVMTQPINDTINAAANASFTVAATANPRPTVQWQLSTDGGATFNNLTNTGTYTGAATDTLSLTGATPADNGYEYRAIFSNTLFGAGSPSSATTSAAKLTVNAAPVVDVNPSSETINAGGNTLFISSATGSPAPSAQWQVSTDGGAAFNNITGGGIYSGATAGTLSITGGLAAMNGYEYQDLFTNGTGDATSSASTLTVDFAATVTANPSDSTIGSGANTSFTAAAAGNPTPTVRWLLSTDGGATFNSLTDTGIYSGVTTDSLTLTGATLTENGFEYQAVFRNALFGAGSPSTAVTTAATLIVSDAPIVDVNPTSATINAGGNTSFTSSATGNPVPAVQWQVSTDGGDAFVNISNGGVYSGATTDTLTLTGATVAENGCEYQAVFSNTLDGAGSPSNATTAAATLTVNAIPVITVSAYAQLVSSTSNAGTLHVQAQQDGTDANLIYTWSIISQPATVSGGLDALVGEQSDAPLVLFSINGTNFAMNTSATFLAPGNYTLQVLASNGTQSVTSQVQVTATVKPSATPATLLSTQVSGVQTIGDAKSITGFVVTFNGPLDPTTAQDIRGYKILRPYTINDSRNFWQRLFNEHARTRTGYAAYKLSTAVYDSQTDSVTLTLASPMPVNGGLRLVQVMGTGPHAVLGADGKAIDGDANGKAGGNFTYRFTMSVAKSVTYHTADGDIVKLSLSGPGEIVALIPTGTESPVIDLVDTDSASSILTGKLRKGRKGLAYAVLDELNGTASADIQLGDEFHVNQNSGAAAV